MRRLPALVLTIAALATLVVVGRSEPDDVVPTFAAEQVTWMPAVSQGPGAVNWYCPGVPAEGDGRGGQVVIANTTPDTISGRYSVLTEDGEAAAEELELAGNQRLEIDVDDLVDAPFASVVVELGANGAFVEQRAVEPDGDYTTPCSNETSDEWYLADGHTLDDSVEELVITNPYESDAVASLSLVTEQGALTPAAYQGFPVAARSVLVIDIAELGVRNEPIAGVTLQSTRGQLVLGRSQRFEGDERGGHTMTLAAPTLAGQWWFVAGERSEEVVEEYRILNTTETDVDVTASALGITPSGDFTGLVDIVAPAGRVTTFDTADVAGLPEGAHSFVFSTIDLPGVVVERVYSRTNELGVATSVSLGGLARPDGFVANNWFVGTSPQGPTDGALLVYNTVSAEATVQVQALTDTGFVRQLGLDQIRVPPGGVRAIDLDDERALGRTLLVTSTRQVFVERQIPRDGPLGGNTMAWPVPLDA